MWCATRLSVECSSLRSSDRNTCTSIESESQHSRFYYPRRKNHQLPLRRRCSHQNYPEQCFKEVYKELKDYEQATGARVNYDKTVGLWVGKWKSRTDDPFSDIGSEDTKKIKWTNKNVKYLGVYVGNDRPDLQTFNEIVPKMKKRLQFWKPLQLPLLAKARVIEIYHASKLFFAANLYPIPQRHTDDITHAFMDYMIFPKRGNIPQVSRKEMENFSFVTRLFILIEFKFISLKFGPATWALF